MTLSSTTRRTCEMAGRWWGDSGEMVGRWWRDGGVMVGRWRGVGVQAVGRWWGDGGQMAGRWPRLLLRVLYRSELLGVQPLHVADVT